MIKQVTIITIVTVFTMWIFRINDPYKILLIVFITIEQPKLIRNIRV